MITSKRSVGGRKLNTYSKSRTFVPTLQGTAKTWTLSNSRVTFIFEEDYLTGVRLKSWKHANSSTTFYNESRNLWTLNVIRQYTVNSTPSSGDARVNVNHYNLYPRKKYFNSSLSISPEFFVGGKRFTFTWNQVPFDQKQIINLCRVFVTATLFDNSDYLDIKVEVEAQPGAFTYSSSILKDFKSAIVTSIQFPTISIKKDSNEAVNNDFILSTPVAYGYTYFNPFKYLRTPRFLEESFQYTHEGERSYAAGGVGEPKATLQRFNYGSPGSLPIPALVIGNKTTLDGTLIYAQDREGTNAKGFQFYFDDQNLHLKLYHMSDHQVDPYGLGGYNNPTLGYSIENKPTWTFRIHPFKSPTIWIDWHGFELYRKEAVTEQEEFGWIGKSLYDRYISSEISKAAAEMPLVLNVYGYTTGQLNTLENSIAYYKGLYKTSVNPNITDNILFPIYYTPATLNYRPQRGTGVTDKIEGAYYGWYPWAGQGTGVGKVGPELFKSPDYTGVNQFHTGAFTRLAQSGDLLYSYNKFPFTISTGSEWTKFYSGIDLSVKSLGREKATYTNDQYKHWAYSGDTPGLFDDNFSSCIGVDIVYDKYIDISSGLAGEGMGVFHDTAGAFGRGCYAKEHRHYNPSTLSTNVKNHPRAGFSKYFNDIQVAAYADYRSKTKESFYDSFGSTIYSGDFIFKQCAEFPSDVLLKDMPVSLTYEPLGPIYNFYFNDVRNPRPDAVLNMAGNTDIDSLPDGTVSALVEVGGVKFWSSFIKSPNWIQRCPAFQIAFSDRCIWDEWVAVHNTNAFSSFFTRGAITGVGLYGKLLKAPITDEYQALNWSSFTAQTWPYTNRISAWHVNNQIGFVTPSLSSIENNEYTVFSTGIWSGYVNNFTKKLMRVQAYNPDYMYHGSLQHPLDLFNSDIIDEPTESRLLRRCSNPNTGNPFTIANTVDKIQHIVRKHRNEENYLIVAGNWFSGNGTFNATFNPLTYGINIGYQVYSLDLETAAHGTKTLLAVKGAGETFDFSATLSEYGYLAYEIEASTTILNPNVFGDVKTNYTPVRYSYDILELMTSDTTFTYSYGTSSYDEIFLPQVGFKSPATQDILNNLPPWMKMRQSVDSNGWKLTNSWGIGLESVLENIKNNIYDINLVTANTKYLSKLDYVDVDSKELLEDTSIRNLLFNSSFEIKGPSRTKLPAGWTDFSTVSSAYLDNINTITTATSVTSNTGKVKLGQQVLLDNIPAKNMTASVYINSNAASVNVKLHISVEKMDGTSLSYSAQTSNRSSEWVRLVLPFEVGSQIYRINYSVIANCSGKVSIACPQLEFNSLSKWSGSIVDRLPYVQSNFDFNAVYATPLSLNRKKIPIYNIALEREFTSIGIPTRVEKTNPPSKDIIFTIENAFGRKVDNQQSITNTEFTVYRDQVTERSLGPSIFDFFGKYSIRDLKFFDERQYGTIEDASVSITPLAAAIRGDYLFVACKEEFNGKTIRTLKVVRPRTPPAGEVYLESFTDFDLELQLFDTLDISQIPDEEIALISFSDMDPTYMVVVTTNNIRHYYKLYFDYYYFNSRKNRMYTIESYKNAKITIL